MLITIELPEGIEKPKFKLFERVEHDGRVCSVVSMRYDQPWLPGSGGWQYELCPMFPLWQDAGCPDYEDGEFVREGELKRPRKPRKSKGKAQGLTRVSDVLPEVTEAIVAA